MKRFDYFFCVNYEYFHLRTNSDKQKSSQRFCCTDTRRPHDCTGTGTVFSLVRWVAHVET
jgi:hypothetical protein